MKCLSSVEIFILTNAQVVGRLIYASLWQEFSPEPVIPIYTAWPDDVEKALKHVYHACTNKLKGKELELLLVILPDNNGSLYGMFMKLKCSVSM